MKLTSAVLFLVAGTGSAFVTPSSSRVSSAFTRHFVLAEAAVNEKASLKEPLQKDTKVSEQIPNMSSQSIAMEKSAQDPRKVLMPGRYDNIDYSITLPFLKRPSKLDGSHAGDFGFDPMGFTEEFDIYYLQECELRHARLAMLAVAGWPLSEMLAPSFMLQDGRAPSVLNGFNPVSAIATLVAFGAFSVLELSSWNRRTAGTKIGNIHLEDMKNIWRYGVAGDYNFDPAGLYNSLGDDAYGRRAMREIEVTQGRYAMVGITYFAFYEAISGNAVVEDNLFFQPNSVLPVLGVAYLIWSQLYEISDLRNYPIKIQKTKLGLELDEWLERRSSAS